MRVGILGSGIVGRTLGSGFAAHGHQTLLGTRDPNRSEVAAWARDTPDAHLGTFAEAAAFGELIVLAVPGHAVAEAIDLTGAAHFAGKTLLDATNPIAAEPAVDGVLSYTTSANESLGEWIQERLPAARVVKAFNSVGSALMVHPRFADGTPTMFYCGNDGAAKAQVAAVISAFGWEPYDCGTIRAARALEPLCILWCIPGLQRNEWRHAFKMLAR